MKRVILFLTAITFALGSLMAQPAKKGDAPKGKERIEQQIQQYTEAFSLNEAQAQQFGSLYRQYSKKLHAIHDLYHQPRPEEGVTLTDEQVEKRILNNFAQSRAILEVRETYYQEFRKILTPTQINQIFEDEKARRQEMRANRPKQ